VYTAFTCSRVEEHAGVTAEEVVYSIKVIIVKARLSYDLIRVAAEVTRNTLHFIAGYCNNSAYLTTGTAAFAAKRCMQVEYS